MKEMAPKEAAWMNGMAALARECSDQIDERNASGKPAREEGVPLGEQGGETRKDTLLCDSTAARMSRHRCSQTPIATPTNQTEHETKEVLLGLSLREYRSPTIGEWSLARGFGWGNMEQAGRD